jgi:16S rRNA processing protein RimM
LSEQHLVVGHISGVFGIKGWVKVYSFTDPRENILTYSPWLLCKGSERKTVRVLNGQSQNGTIVAHLDGIDDRDSAAELGGWEILIDEKLLPEPEEDEYYWRDLIGLAVVNLENIHLGTVDYLLETGANDVLVVKDDDKERLIPFVQGQFVKSIDLHTRLITVDWDAEF